MPGGDVPGQRSRARTKHRLMKARKTNRKCLLHMPTSHRSRPSACRTRTNLLLRIKKTNQMVAQAALHPSWRPLFQILSLSFKRGFWSSSDRMQSLLYVQCFQLFDLCNNFWNASKKGADQLYIHAWEKFLFFGSIAFTQSFKQLLGIWLARRSRSSSTQMLQPFSPHRDKKRSTRTNSPLQLHSLYTEDAENTDHYSCAAQPPASARTLKQREQVQVSKQAHHLVGYWQRRLGEGISECSP